jgi:hypothetical protein
MLLARLAFEDVTLSLDTEIDPAVLVTFFDQLAASV